jgi:hypothetical protein
MKRSQKPATPFSSPRAILIRVLDELLEGRGLTEVAADGFSPLMGLEIALQKLAKREKRTKKRARR